MAEQVARESAAASASASASGSGSSELPSSAQSALDDSDSVSDMATAGWTSARSSVSYASDSVRMPYSPIGDDGNRFGGVHTPISVERKYKPVVYGDFLMKKVAGNFDSGKGRY